MITQGMYFGILLFYTSILNVRLYSEYFIVTFQLSPRFITVVVDCTHYIVLYTQQCVMNDAQIE